MRDSVGEVVNEAGGVQNEMGKGGRKIVHTGLMVVEYEGEMSDSGGKGGETGPIQDG